MNFEATMIEWADVYTSRQVFCLVGQGAIPKSKRGNVATAGGGESNNVGLTERSEGINDDRDGTAQQPQ